MQCNDVHVYSQKINGMLWPLFNVKWTVCKK